MTDPTTWTAHTVAEAIDLLHAIEHSIQTGLTTAQPGKEPGCAHPGRDNPLNISLTFYPQPNQA